MSTSERKVSVAVFAATRTMGWVVSGIEGFDWCHLTEITNVVPALFRPELLLAVTSERLSVGFIGRHIDAVAQDTAFPGALFLTDLGTEVDLEISPDLRLNKRRQPLTPLGTEVPFALLDRRV
jgi:hypothetical protein